MHVSKRFVFLVTAVAVSTLTTCTTAPETGHSQLILIDSAQETKIGFQAFREETQGAHRQLRVSGEAAAAGRKKDHRGGESTPRPVGVRAVQGPGQR